MYIVVDNSILIRDPPPYIFHVLGWKLGDFEKKQKCSCKSRVEIEFQVVAQVIFKLLWLKNILNDLKTRCEEPLL